MKDLATVDLHLHTTASDGRLTPTELVNLLGERGLRFVSITDHDSTEGLAEAYEAKERFPDLKLIPGIELSTEAGDSEIHVLGYFLDWKNPDFQRVLAGFRQGRVGRGRAMVDRLGELGLPVEWERVLHFAGDGAVGRPHIALAMVEQGYVPGVREAFDLYLGRDGPAYVDRQKLSPVDAVSIIRGVGGAAVLAHPSYVNNLDSHLAQMKDAGLAGMEVHYSHYPPKTVRKLGEIAKRFDLLACGGSDYHALGQADETLPGHQGPPESVVEALYARCARGAASPTED